MPFAFGIGQHPNTKQPLLMVAAQPEPFAAPQVLGLLRILKQAFPQEFRTVQYELIVPVNGKPGLEIPEDIHGAPTSEVKEPDA